MIVTRHLEYYSGLVDSGYYCSLLLLWFVWVCGMARWEFELVLAVDSDMAYFKFTCECGN